VVGSRAHESNAGRDRPSKTCFAFGMPKMHDGTMGPVNDLGEDLELRLVRYFAAVAEHLNFGRAAAELHLAQPSLSRQIQRLEDRLGVRLFDRTPQGTLLTEAGKAFLPEAQTLLQAARQAMATARAYTPTGRITIGYVEDVVITAAVREFRRRHPEAEIDTRHLDCQGADALPEGRVDVLIGRAPLPFPTSRKGDNRGIRATVLYEEPRMLVVPVDHDLAARASVALEELAGEQPVPCPLGADVWSAYRFLGPGPTIQNFEDKLELVAAGRAIAVLPIGDRRSTLRPDLITVPLEGAPTSKVVLATRIGDPNPRVRDFQAAARASLTR
jgi:DNA-binding transcriptional LysR family regulator